MRDTKLLSQPVFSSILLTLFLILLPWPIVAALQTARMQLPVSFEQQALRLHGKGIGGRNKGTYTLGEYHGSFTRADSRLGVFDPLYVKSFGGSTFTMMQQDDSAHSSAQCHLRKGAVTIGVFTFDIQHLTYQCEFTQPQQPVAKFNFGHAKSTSTKDAVLAKDRRVGEVRMFDQQYLVESVYNYKGTRFSSQTAVGYLIQNNDRMIAAVELTDVNPLLYINGDAQVEQRQAVTMIALALALFRDPAVSPLYD